jgi:hypothetical protein
MGIIESSQRTLIRSYSNPIHTFAQFQCCRYPSAGRWFWLRFICSQCICTFRRARWPHFQGNSRSLEKSTHLRMYTALCPKRQLFDSTASRTSNLALESYHASWDIKNSYLLRCFNKKKEYVLSVNPCMLQVHYRLLTAPLRCTTQTYWSQLDVMKSRTLLAAKYPKT